VHCVVGGTTKIHSFSISSATMVDLLERIDVMLRQEASVYKTEDYLAPEFQHKLSLLMTDDSGDEIVPLSCSGTVNSSSCTSSSSGGINELWREKICEWSYQVIDHFDFSREVVSVSIHLLDRYLSTRTVNKKVFQLAAMTTLFLAIKLYEPGKLSMSSMIELSRGFFLVEQMAAMEVSILRYVSLNSHSVSIGSPVCLQWRQT
jgi:Cyclin, N-terminal domain